MAIDYDKILVAFDQPRQYARFPKQIMLWRRAGTGEWRSSISHDAGETRAYLPCGLPVSTSPRDVARTIAAKHPGYLVGVRISDTLVRWLKPANPRKG